LISLSLAKHLEARAGWTLRGLHVLLRWGVVPGVPLQDFNAKFFLKPFGHHVAVAVVFLIKRLSLETKENRLHPFSSESLKVVGYF
jgi:hypothetical protein